MCHAQLSRTLFRRNVSVAHPIHRKDLEYQIRILRHTRRDVAGRWVLKCSHRYKSSATHHQDPAASVLRSLGRFMKVRAHVPLDFVHASGGEDTICKLPSEPCRLINQYRTAIGRECRTDIVHGISHQNRLTQIQVPILGRLVKQALLRLSAGAIILRYV